MINIKETLKKLHNKFPDKSLDELFDITDCIVEAIDLRTFDKPNPLDLRKYPWMTDIVYCNTSNNI